MTNDPNIIVDAHQDIALNVAVFGRDFTNNAYKQRQIEQGTETAQNRGLVTLGLPNALLGRVGIVFGTLFVAPAWAAKTYDIGYETPADAYKKALPQIDVYHRLAETNERISLVRKQSELSDVLATWTDGVDFEKHRLGIVIAHP
jgi:membrane dipeptidase